MGVMTIDGRRVEFTDERNVLTVIRKAGIDIPTLCYHSELSTFGACRLCTVEDDRGRTFASCSEEPRDGMVIYTNSAKIRKYRKLIVELLLAAHCRDCTTCIKSGECALQTLAHRLGVMEVRFQNTRERQPLDFSSPAIVRDPNKCILCGNCVRVCEEIQGVGVLGFTHRGTDACVSPAFNKPISSTDCVNCGQCRVYCPTGAITIRTNMDQVWDALADPKVRVVAQIAPAVRVAVGEAFGLPRGENAIGKVVAVLHRMGFDEVFDTAYSADLTIMEEAAEFLERLKEGKNLPLLTSCCPAWVKFVGDHFPDYKDNVSTCRCLLYTSPTMPLQKRNVPVPGPVGLTPSRVITWGGLPSILKSVSPAACVWLAVPLELSRINPRFTNWQKHWRKVRKLLLKWLRRLWDSLESR